MNDTQTYLYNQLVTILTNNNPGASAASVQQLATELSGLWATLILPNLQVDLSTGKVTFIVPTS